MIVESLFYLCILSGSGSYVLQGFEYRVYNFSYSTLRLWFQLNFDEKFLNISSKISKAQIASAQTKHILLYEVVLPQSIPYMPLLARIDYKRYVKLITLGGKAKIVLS